MRNEITGVCLNAGLIWTIERKSVFLVGMESKNTRALHGVNSGIFYLKSFHVKSIERIPAGSSIKS